MAFHLRQFHIRRRLSEDLDSQLSRGASTFPGTVALLLALLAPALGGGTSPMAVAVLLAGIGLAAVALPARGLRAGFMAGAGLLLVATLDWTWPAGMNQLPWRGRFDEAGFSLAWCSSPEPWVSMRAWLLLLGGVVWAGWCAGQVWTNGARRAVCEGLAVGIGVIALVALAAPNGHVPGWPNGIGLGPFENRNQSATLFAVGAFLALVCGEGRFRRLAGLRKRLGPLMGQGLVWMGLMAVYTLALARDGSRSGPLLFAGMTLAWLLTARPPWRRKPETLGGWAVIGLLLGAFFLLTGRVVITRLATSNLMDFRIKIFSDSLGMIWDSPWTGSGLGCFGAVFPLYRHASIVQERVLHPESDWLWLVAETGLPGLLAMAGLAGWMGVRAWRGVRACGEGRAMRLAVCVACLGVLAHSFVDVPGHRLGTLMPALLLLGLAAGADDMAERWPGSVLRGAGLAVLLVGVGFMGVLALKIPVPIENGMGLLGNRAASEEAAGRCDQAEATMRQALQWAPLDWRLYVERAQIEGAQGELMEALGDFRRACFLEPNYAGLPFDEGVYWLGMAPRFAIEAWTEAMRRTPPERHLELYRNMLGHAFASHPDLHAALWSMASTDGPMQLVYFEWAVPDEFKARLADILRDDPALARFSTEQLRGLFPIWMEKGEVARLAFLMSSHPEWLKAGYRALAKYDAARGDLADAVDLMERYLPLPRVPQPAAMTHAEAAKRFEADNGDIAAGMVLYYEAIAAGREKDALETLKGMGATPGCPGYVHYLAGRLLAKEEKIDQAWKEFDLCPDTYPR